MARDERTPPDPERRNLPDRRAASHAEASPSRRGRSGYGVDSIRPHLRAQLEQRKLWRTEFPPQAPKDEPDDEES